MLSRHSLPAHAGETTVQQRLAAALTEEGEEREAQLIVQHKPEELACTQVQTTLKPADSLTQPGGPGLLEGKLEFGHGSRQWLLVLCNRHRLAVPDSWSSHLSSLQTSIELTSITLEPTHPIHDGTVDERLHRQVDDLHTALQAHGQRQL